MPIKELLIESLQLLGLGMGAVFVILTLMIALITIVSRLVPEEASPGAVVAPTADNQDHVAAITAAIQQYRKNRK